ncbi:MAG: hypothetical protein MJ201_01815 [Mycoplasmoidaceae bacterium]|nr:hypothetical protein [Mycoplasmoidaceae bacterium]
MDGHLICLFGLTTQATITDGNKDVVNHYSFIDYNSAVSYSAYLCQKELGPD